MRLRTTIIIGNYNYANYITKALDSILDNNPAYVVVVDDASTDNSVEVIRSHPIMRTSIGTLLINETNCGSMVNAWNKGIEIAKRNCSEFIFFLSADDLLPANSIPALEKFADSVFGDWYYYNILYGNFDDRGKLLKVLQIVDYPVQLTARNVLSFILQNYRLPGLPILALIRTEFIEKHKLVATAFKSRRYEDLHTTLHWMLARPAMVHYNKVCYNYRVHDKAISSNITPAGKLARDTELHEILRSSDISEKVLEIVTGTSVSM